MGVKGVVSQAWAHKPAAFNSQSLVLRVGGANFLHCLNTYSIYFKINLPKGLYPKKPAGMHWLGRNDAVP